MHILFLELRMKSKLNNYLIMVPILGINMAKRTQTVTIKVLKPRT